MYMRPVTSAHVPDIHFTNVYLDALDRASWKRCRTRSDKQSESWLL